MEKENRRLQRVNSDIYRIIATYISEKDLQTEVVEVKTSADLSETKVFVTAEVEIMEGAASFLRTEIARLMNLRNTPKIRFIKDKGRDNATRVNELLDQISKGKK